MATIAEGEPLEVLKEPHAAIATALLRVVKVIASARLVLGAVLGASPVVWREMNVGSCGS